MYLKKTELEDVQQNGTCTGSLRIMVNGGNKVLQKMDK